MLWKIYYADGSTFSHEDGLPEEAPLDGVIVIVDHDKDGIRRYNYDRDFYIWLGDRWHCGYQREFDTWVRNYMKQIKYGICVSDEDYKRIINGAMQW
jgi:hypothetical protein